MSKGLIEFKDGRVYEFEQSEPHEIVTNTFTVGREVINLSYIQALTIHTLERPHRLHWHVSNVGVAKTHLAGKHWLYVFHEAFKEELAPDPYIHEHSAGMGIESVFGDLYCTSYNIVTAATVFKSEDDENKGPKTPVGEHEAKNRFMAKKMLVRWKERPLNIPLNILPPRNPDDEIEPPESREECEVLLENGQANHLHSRGAMKTLNYDYAHIHHLYGANGAVAIIKSDNLAVHDDSDQAIIYVKRGDVLRVPIIREAKEWQVDLIAVSVRAEVYGRESIFGKVG